MKRVQIFLSVNAAKWLIAEAISRRPEVQTALENGTLILKGGTTTSCLSAILTGSHLRLCGRVTCRGAVANLKESSNPHTVLLSRQGIRSLDGLERDAFLKFGPECVLVTGANLIDCSGGAALLAGSPGGGSYGAALSAIETEGIRVLIAAGTEKLTSGNISSAVALSQRKHVSASHGMACGLLPLAGLLGISISIFLRAEIKNLCKILQRFFCMTCGKFFINFRERCYILYAFSASDLFPTEQKYRS